MQTKSYIGIDSHNGSEWIVALLVEGEAVCFRTFQNTTQELMALVRFIGEHCPRPKICLKPSNRAALKLIKLIGGIPDVEVVLMSPAGLMLHEAWLRQAIASLFSQANQALMLARCAEHMI